MYFILIFSELLVQIGHAEAFLLVLIFDVPPKEIHHFVLIFGRCWFGADRPIIDVPVVRWLIDQLIVHDDLRFGHAFQELRCECTQQQIIFEHTTFPALVQQSTEM